MEGFIYMPFTHMLPWPVHHVINKITAFSLSINLEGENTIHSQLSHQMFANH